MENDNKKSIQDKLALIKYNCDSKTHLILDRDKCAKCKEKTCVFICPAGVYSIDENSDEIIVLYENCLECGACRVACQKNAIDWNYPKAACGIVLKHN